MSEIVNFLSYLVLSIAIIFFILILLIGIAYLLLVTKDLYYERKQNNAVKYIKSLGLKNRIDTFKPNTEYELKNGDTIKYDLHGEMIRTVNTKRTVD